MEQKSSVMNLTFESACASPDEDQPQSSTDAVLNESARIVADIIGVS